MKKLVLILIFLGSVIPSFSQEIQLTEKEKEEAWEFILMSYYARNYNTSNHEFSSPERFYEDIKVYLKNANDKDYEVFDKMKKELEPLIPLKINLVQDSLNANFKIDLVNATELQWNHKPGIANRDGLYNNELYRQDFELICPEEYRENALKNTLILGLVAGYKYRHSDFTQSDFLKTSNKSVGVIDEFYILKIFPFYRENRITDFDKYIVQQIYSDDYVHNLNYFVKEIYGYWMYLNWKSADALKMIKVFVFILYFLIAFMLGYKFLFNRGFNSKWYGYILSSVFIGIVIAFSFVLASRMVIYSTNLFIPREEYEFTFKRFLFPTLFSSITGSIVGIMLYFTEKYFLRIRDLFYKALLRVILQLVVFGLALFLMLIVFVFNGNKDAFEEFTPIYFPLLIFFFIIALGRSVFLYFKERNENLIREKDVQLANLTASKAEAEVASLHARINPHFLYNSLNAIASLAHTDADKTEKMALSLSDLFKHNLNRKNEASCTVSEEVDAVRAYLEIEKIRFGESLNYEIDMAESVKNYAIPRNIIQPLLENAIKHGVSQLQQSGFIKLKIHESQTDLIIAVYDNGPAFTDGLVSGYGLQSIYDILNFTYGDMAAISWQNKPEKLVFITIALDELKTSEA